MERLTLPCYTVYQSWSQLVKMGCNLHNFLSQLGQGWCFCCRSKQGLQQKMLYYLLYISYFITINLYMQWSEKFGQRWTRTFFSNYWCPKLHKCVKICLNANKVLRQIQHPKFTHSHLTLLLQASFLPSKHVHRQIRFAWHLKPLEVGLLH